MRNLLNPKWSFAMTIIPLSITFLAYLRAFVLVRPQLSEVNINHWTIFGSTLLFLFVAHLIHILICIKKSRRLSIIYGVITVLAYTSFLYLYWQHSSHIFPSNIPAWMIPTNMPFYLSIALMPTIVHAIYTIVAGLTPSDKSIKVWHNLAGAAAVPASWYLFFQVILPVWQPVDSDFGEHVLIIMIVISTITFLFFVIRGVYVISRKRRQDSQNFSLVWKIIFSMIFPVLGLAINNNTGANIFGDFSSPWFYVIVIINGVLICISGIVSPKIRLALFILKGITFTYVLYFFLVFLPYLPLSILIIILFGAGFLMLAPLILMIIQVNNLIEDFEFLKNHYFKSRVVGLFLLGSLILPALVTFNYLNDRTVLHQALTYAFEDQLGDEGKVRLSSLKRTISTLETHKSRDFGIGTPKPILTPYYNWLVLDNMTLSDYKIHMLKEIYFGNTLTSHQRNNMFLVMNQPNESVLISSITAHSEFVENNYWKSTITINIKNFSALNFAEFVSSFDLPEGAWVTNYSLWIGDHKEPGILAEKKAATWLYQQITDRNRDPGILYYLSGKNVALRVFPLSAGEERKTEIELIHKEPMKFKIENQTVQLGKDTEEIALDNPIVFDNSVYLSQKIKSRLPKVHREPYLHFLIDVSVKNQVNLEDYVQQTHLMSRRLNLMSKAKISLVNSRHRTFDYSTNWQEDVKSKDFKGGFFLEKAFKGILYQNFINQEAQFPIFVVVTDDLESAIFSKNLSDYEMTFPETPVFYVLGPDGELSQNSLVQNPLVSQKLTGDITTKHAPVLKWKNGKGESLFLKDNLEPSIIPVMQEIKGQELETTNLWASGLLMESKWKRFRFGSLNPQESWLDLVRSSFKLKIMNPTTSFLALENESQKILLKRKQAQVLSGKRSLDLGEDVQRMSEPNIIIVVIGFFILLSLSRKKRTMTSVGAK